MPESYVRHLPGDRTCDICGETGCDPLYQHIVTRFFYCDEHRRRYPDTDLVKVV
jgi:hypothetical protein